mmetsp:Transcript_6252/g.12479  ORF Transcript_6252/g.12479 Transcript_6252/m.12479 type:complete len:325 (-) Transcript_6252:58-1032(-)
MVQGGRCCRLCLERLCTDLCGPCAHTAWPSHGCVRYSLASKGCSSSVLLMQYSLRSTICACISSLCSVTMLSALTRSLYIFSRSWCEVVRNSAYSFCSAAIFLLLSQMEPPPWARRSRMCACRSSASLLRSSSSRLSCSFSSFSSFSSRSSEALSARSPSLRSSASSSRLVSSSSASSLASCAADSSCCTSAFSRCNAGTSAALGSIESNASGRLESSCFCSSTWKLSPPAYLAVAGIICSRTEQPLAFCTNASSCSSFLLSFWLVSYRCWLCTSFCSLSSCSSRSRSSCSERMRLTSAGLYSCFAMVSLAASISSSSCASSPS